MHPHTVHLPLSTFGHEALARLQEDTHFFDSLNVEEVELVIAASVVLDKVTTSPYFPSTSFGSQPTFSLVHSRRTSTSTVLGRWTATTTRRPWIQSVRRVGGDGRMLDGWTGG